MLSEWTKVLNFVDKGNQPWNHYANVALIRCLESSICPAPFFFFLQLNFPIKSRDNTGSVMYLCSIKNFCLWFLTRKQIEEPKAWRMAVSTGLLFKSYNVLFLWNKARKVILIGTCCPQNIWSPCLLLLISSLHRRNSIRNEAKSPGVGTGAGWQYSTVSPAYLKEKCIICMSVGDRWDLTVSGLCAPHVYHKS